MGIFGGSFDPVHVGHISFALQAATQAHLDRVYFMPDRQPRNQRGVSHFGHRIAMLKRAVKPHHMFGVIELVDIHFSISRSLPRLQHKFPGAQLVFLMGADVARAVPTWTDYERLVQTAELVIGVDSSKQASELEATIQSWKVQPKRLVFVARYAPDISSAAVREGLKTGRNVRGILSSVWHYSNRHWLYVSIR